MTPLEWCKIKRHMENGMNSHVFPSLFLSAIVPSTSSALSSLLSARCLVGIRLRIKINIEMGPINNEQVLALVKIAATAEREARWKFTHGNGWHY